MHGLCGAPEPGVDGIELDVRGAVGYLDAHEGRASPFPGPQFDEHSTITCMHDLLAVDLVSVEPDRTR